jgi:hypothetical protein
MPLPLNTFDLELIAEEAEEAEELADAEDVDALAEEGSPLESRS